MKKSYIPTINISKLNLENINSKNNLILKQIQKACIDVGFFQIVGHGIEKNLIKKITKIAHIFFNSKIKNKYKLAPKKWNKFNSCLLYTSPSPRDAHESRMPSSA